MPGLLLAHSFSFDAFNFHSKRILHDNRYQVDMQWTFQDVIVATSTYAGYPIEKHVFGDFELLLEGAVYQQTVEQRKDIFRDFFKAGKLKVELVKKWVEISDGSFVLLVLNKQRHEIHLFNDQWGRLPVYYWNDGKKLVLSREIAFVRWMSDCNQFCQFGAAENLLFGFPLGRRTIWKAIMCLEPGSMLFYDLQSATIKVEGSYQAFQTLNHAHGSLDELLPLFENGLKSRLANMKRPVLSLSGGLDSRLIAAVLAHAKIDFNSLTYALDNDATALERQSVDAIVAQLNISHHHRFVELNAQASMADLQLLLNAKQGMNYAGMAFLLPFLAHFATHSYSMLTGDGGDKLLADLRPYSKLKNNQQVLSYLLHHHSIVSVEILAKWFGFSRHDLISHLYAHLEEYQQRHPLQTYYQFLLRERAGKWLFEGEDRNRLFCWSETPLYNPEFARVALSIPMEVKANGRLFAKLFEQMPGDLNTVVNPNWELPPNEEKAISMLMMRQRIKSKWPLHAINRLRVKEKALETFPHKKLLLDFFPEGLADQGINIETEDVKRLKKSDGLWHLLGLLLLKRKADAK